MAQLAPQEHTRALESVLAWCDARGVATADDLLGGATELSADRALWEAFLDAARLPSDIFSNRVRRELMRRRAALLDGALPAAGEAAARGRLPRKGKGGKDGAAPGSRRSCELQ